MSAESTAKFRFRRMALRDAGGDVSRVPNKWTVQTIVNRLFDFTRQNEFRGSSKGWVFMLLPLLCMTGGLQGCHSPASPPAPSPTPNPHSQVTSHLKISVQDGSGVDKVVVRSVWTVGNIGCAPIQPISGAAIVKQVEAQEKVDKVGSSYVATIVDDRFLPDKCNWLGGAYEINFMHDNHVLSILGAGPNEFDASGKLELTCTPPPDKPPTCFLRNQEAFLRSHFHGVFNVTLERVK